METTGMINYPPSGQPMPTSTKVMNLSRAQINLQQPSASSGPQTYYAQPAQSNTMVGSPGGYPMAQSHPGYGQPQIYTVGSMQPMGQQQPQPIRVFTASQQPSGVEPMRQQMLTAGQPMNYQAQPSVIYYGQPQPTGQTFNAPQQYTTYAQPPVSPQSQQQQQFTQMNQQPIRQAFQGQVVYAQTAAAAARPTYPQSNQPVNFQTQPRMQDMPPQATNQQQANYHQPISNQSSQQWVTQAPGATQRQYQTPSQPVSQFGATGYTAQQAFPNYNQIPPQPERPVQESITPNYQPTQQQFQQPPRTPESNLRTRTPSASGLNRKIKVRSLPMRGTASMDALDKAVGPPQFVQQPTAQLTVNEGEPVTISCCVRPAGDSTLSVEWYKNGKPLSASSRFSTIFDRGHAILEFIYTNEEDNGEYSCVANNCCGQDQSTGCRLSIIPEEAVVTETQLPEESMVANLAAMENQMLQNGLARSNRYRDEPRPVGPPQFVKPIAPQVGIRELAPAHFETIIEPANDSSLIVEWYKDGKPVSMGCRFNAVLDRGFAILDILYCYPEDNGSYFCIAKNANGQVQSNVVELQCSAEASIVTNSVLSKESVSYLQSLDNWGSEQMAGYDRQVVDEEEPPSAPAFDIFPQPLTVTEGGPAKFMVKASGYPRPKVQWYIDGELLASQGGGGNWRIYQDGGISHLEFHRVGNPCQQQIRAVAKNNYGEVAADTVLVIEPQLDFRPDLRHVQPENPFKKLAQLKRVERTSELASAFNRPRPQALDLRRIERQSEFKARTAAEAESLEAENLYSRVQAQLRTSRRTSLPPPSPPIRAAPIAPQVTQPPAPRPPPTQTQPRPVGQQPSVAQTQRPPAPVPQQVPTQRPAVAVGPQPTQPTTVAPPPPPPAAVAPPPPSAAVAPPPPPPPAAVAPPPPPPPVAVAPPPPQSPAAVAPPPPPPSAAVVPPPPPPPAAVAPSPPPPPAAIPPPPPLPQTQAPPPPPPPIQQQLLTNQVESPPIQHQAETEYLHDEVSAEFTIEL